MNSNRILKRYSAMEGSLSYFLAVIAYLLISVLFSLIARKADGDVLNFFFGLAVQGGFLLAAWLPSRVLGSELSYKFAKISPRKCLLALPIAVICVLGFDGLALAFNYLLIGNGYVDQSAALSGGLVIALLVVRSVLVAPVCEEALFRGSVLSSLGVMGSFKKRNRVFFMIIVCGLLFAVMHMNPMQTVYQFLLGGTLAYVTIRFGSIIPAIIIHMLNNLIGVTLTLTVDSYINTFMLDIYGTGWYVLFVAVSVVLAIAAVFVIRLLCRKFGGSVPESPDKELRTEGGSFSNFSDDSGTLGGAIIVGVGALICVIMWISALLSGFGA